MKLIIALASCILIGACAAHNTDMMDIQMPDGTIFLVPMELVVKEAPSPCIERPVMFNLRTMCR
jgi:hypothetical protein